MMNYKTALAFLLSVAAGVGINACKWGTDRLEEKRENLEERDGEFLFNDYDSDRNGFLNADEINRYKPEYSQSFETIDVDRDEQVSEEELQIFGEREE